MKILAVILAVILCVIAYFLIGLFTSYIMWRVVDRERWIILPSVFLWPLMLLILPLLGVVYFILNPPGGKLADAIEKLYRNVDA